MKMNFSGLFLGCSLALLLGAAAARGQRVTGTITGEVTDPSGAVIPGADSVLDLENYWTHAEFNVIGDGGGSAADFNSGSTLVVQTSVDNGTTDAPQCGGPQDGGYTGETNNLTLEPQSAPICCPYGGSSPGVQFLESNVPGTTTTCGATGVNFAVEYGATMYGENFPCVSEGGGEPANLNAQQNGAGSLSWTVTANNGPHAVTVSWSVADVAGTLVSGNLSGVDPNSTVTASRRPVSDPVFSGWADAVAASGACLGDAQFSVTM